MMVVGLNFLSLLFTDSLSGETEKIVKHSVLNQKIKKNIEL